MDSIQALVNEIDPEDWSEEGNREILVAARIIDSLSDKFPLEDIKTFKDFIDGNECAGIVINRLLEKKVKIIKNEPDEPNHRILTLFSHQRKWIKEELEKLSNIKTTP